MHVFEVYFSMSLLYGFTTVTTIALTSGLKFLMVVLLLQKAMLLQQSTWQNNVRMGNLVEQVWVMDCCCIPVISHFHLDLIFLFLQIRGPLSSIQTLSKILSAQTKRTQV